VSIVAIPRLCPSCSGQHLQDVVARTVTRVLPRGVPAPPIPVSPWRPFHPRAFTTLFLSFSLLAGLVRAQIIAE